MADLKWLGAYSGQTLDELLSLAGDYRIDSLVAAVQEALDGKAARLGQQSLSDAERVVLAVEALEREVNNGGYGQFFINSSSGFAQAIVDSLLRIGCPKTANITKSAIEALHVPDLGAHSIETAMASDSDERDDELDRCNEMYYQAGEDIAGQLFAFIRTNQRSVSL